MRKVLILLALGLAACTGVRLPETPDAPLVRDEPILCSDKVYYLHTYDTNPKTEAFIAVIGPADRDHNHGKPFLVIVADDDKNLTFYVSVDGREAERLTREEFEARYGAGPNGICVLGATRRTGV